MPRCFKLLLILNYLYHLPLLGKSVCSPNFFIINSPILRESVSMGHLRPGSRAVRPEPRRRDCATWSETKRGSYPVAYSILTSSLLSSPHFRASDNSPGPFKVCPMDPFEVCNITWLSPLYTQVHSEPGCPEWFLDNHPVSV